MRIALSAVLLALLLTTACGDDGGGNPDAALAADGSTTPDATTSGADAAGSFEFDENGCLTYASASKLCGFDSDDSVCAQKLSCEGGDDGQCKINCEMGTTVNCYKLADVECLLSAVAAHDCAALAACHWIL